MRIQGMMWHIQYRENGADHILRRPTPEGAIEEACRLMDAGYDVFAIGAESLADSIGKDEIEKIYIMWERARPRLTRARTTQATIHS